MFTFYKKHNNKLYNKLVELSRNKFLYEDLKLSDNFETRALLIFFHLAIILKVKKNNENKELLQNLFDNTFHNIEIDKENTTKLADYFEKFENFCFDLDINNMIKGSIDFKYR